MISFKLRCMPGTSACRAEIAGCRAPTACAAFASRFVRRKLQEAGDGETAPAELVKAIAECVLLAPLINSQPAR